MRTVWHIVLGAWLLVGAQIGGVATAQTAYPAQADSCGQTLTVRVAETYFPFSVKNDNGDPSGTDIKFIRQILSSMGCRFEFVFMPWKRALHGIENGELDVLPSASITPEREEFARFSHPYRNEVSGMVIRKGDIGRFPLQTVDDIFLYNMKLGYVRGAYRGALFAAFLEMPGADKQLIEVSKAEHGLNLLLNGRIDGVVGSPAITLAYADQVGFADQIMAHPFKFGVDPIHLMYSKKSVSKELVGRIDVAFDAAVKTQAYKALYGIDAVTGMSGN